MSNDERVDDAGDDAALFESVVSAASENDLSQSQEQETHEAPTVDETLRDTSGKFAKAEESPKEQAKAEEAQAADQSKDKAEAHVPSFRVKEEADGRRRAEERAAQLERENAEMRQMFMQTMQRLNQSQQPQQAVEPPDMFSDPDAWHRHKVETEIHPELQRIRAERMADARAIAEVVYSPDKVAAAEQAFNDLASRGQVDPADYQRIANSPNKYRAAVEWFDRQAVLKEVGSDPAAFKTRLREELKADPEFVREVIEAFKTGGASPATQPTNVTRLPPSLNRATSAAPTHAKAGEQMSDSELWNVATRRR